MVRRAYPVRTCVGCRKRAPASELLRIVAVDRQGDRVSAGTAGEGVFVLVPDPTRGRPGRGAHLHPDPACLALALRRRAFGRALRIAGVLDSGSLVEALDPSRARFGTADGGSAQLHPDNQLHPDKQGGTTDMSTR